MAASDFQALSKPELRSQKTNRKDFPSKPRNPVQLVLDGVTQHYNIGAIFRLADALLVEQVVVCGTPVNIRNRRLVQAARGTQGWVPWSECESAEIAVHRAVAEGYQIVLAELTEHSIRPEEFQPKLPVCLVLGSEKSGVSSAVAFMADTAIAVPMQGMANSINVATAAAIILYQIIHQSARHPDHRCRCHLPSYCSPAIDMAGS